MRKQMIRRQKQTETKIADKVIKKVEEKMTKRDKEMSGSMMFLEELLKAGKTPQAIVLAGDEDSVSGTIEEDPETGEMYIEVELED
jgi:hypothetical protein|tara:strand:+ start:226 stop:483 length:258 start_codon:yes stop_codon:yes gene_type:complete